MIFDKDKISFCLSGFGLLSVRRRLRGLWERRDVYSDILKVNGWAEKFINQSREGGGQLEAGVCPFKPRNPGQVAFCP